MSGGIDSPVVVTADAPRPALLLQQFSGMR